MINKFVKLYEENIAMVRTTLEAKFPEEYKEIVVAVIKAINPERKYGLPDHEKVHSVDDGDYQGVLVFVIGASGYQPEDYWYVKVDYGSCSGCDTLQALEYDSPDEKMKGLMTLALHILQGLKPMQDDD